MLVADEMPPTSEALPLIGDILLIILINLIFRFILWCYDC